MALAQGRVVHIADDETGIMPRPPRPFSQVICHFSEDIAGQLRQVALLGHLLQVYGSALPVTLLVRERMPWLYGTLLHLTGQAAGLQGVWVLDARTPVAGLAALMQGVRPAAATPLSGRESYTLATGLTRRELEVVTAVLTGERMREMALRTGLSPSVLYAQRHHGLRKLGAGKRLPDRKKETR